MAIEDLTLSDVDQADYDTAEAVIISLSRTEYPTLDLRRGTVLRDLLIRPAATYYALDTARFEQLRKMQSLTELLANTATVDPDDVNAILSNFNMARNAGANATGSVMVKVSASRTYTVPAGFTFQTLTGQLFVVASTYAVTPTADVAAGELELRAANDGSYYYFVVPATADTAGAAYNIEQGTMLDTAGSLFGFIAAEAYSNFTAGVDAETIAQAITRIPVAISERSLTSRTSIEGKLRDAFDGTSVAIQAISALGMGDAAQLRDKHNPMGFTSGSRIDLYLRTFVSPSIVVMEKTGTLSAENQYQFNISAADAPGFYAIRAITEIETVLTPTITFGELPAVGSYPFAETRTASGINDTFHDIDPVNGVIETAYTIFQQSAVTVQNVPSSDATRKFKVEVYVAPGLTDLQAYVDMKAVRNLEADVLCRCPLMVMVGLESTFYYDPKNPVDTAALITSLCSYINTRSFTPYLTRSELANLILQAGALRVDLSTAGTQLQGYVRDASGTTHQLAGDTLSVNDVEDASVLLVENAAVFVAEPQNIFLKALPYVEE